MHEFNAVLYKWVRGRVEVFHFPCLAPFIFHEVEVIGRLSLLDHVDLLGACGRVCYEKVPVPACNVLEATFWRPQHRMVDPALVHL
jgi:hypothetical protein